MNTRPSDGAPREAKRRRSDQAWFFAGFGLAVSVFLAMAVTSYRTFEEFSASAAAVDHSRRVIASLDSLLNAVADLEARQRAYLLSEDLEFLQRYSDRMGDVEELMRSLEAAVAENPRRRDALQALRRLIETKADSLLTAALRQSEGHFDSSALRTSAVAMDEIRAATVQMRSNEERLLVQRAATVEAVSQRSRQVILYGGAGGLLLLLLAGWLFERNVTERKRVEAERERFFTLSLDLLSIAGINGYFRRLNPAFAETLGWTQDEMMSRPFIDFVYPDDRAATRAQLDQLTSKLERWLPASQQ